MTPVAVSKLRSAPTSRLEALLASQSVQQDTGRRIRIPRKVVGALIVSVGAIAVVIGQVGLALQVAVGLVVGILIILFGQELWASFGPDYWRWIGGRVAGRDRARRGIRWALAVAIAVVAIPVMALMWLISKGVGGRSLDSSDPLVGGVLGVLGVLEALDEPGLFEGSTMPSGEDKAP